MVRMYVHKVREDQFQIGNKSSKLEQNIKINLVYSIHMQKSGAFMVPIKLIIRCNVTYAYTVPMGFDRITFCREQIKYRHFYLFFLQTNCSAHFRAYLKRKTLHELGQCHLFSRSRDYISLHLRNPTKFYSPLWSKGLQIKRCLHIQFV